MGLVFYDPDGRPIDVMEWARLFAIREECLIAEDQLRGGERLVTAWIGHDICLGDCDPPHIYGTALIFKGAMRQEMGAATVGQALNHHQRLLDGLGVE